MSRVEKFEKNRAKEKVTRTCIYCVAGTIILTILFYGIFMDIQNSKLRDFILNYDKTKEVWNLQEDLRGGNF